MATYPVIKSLLYLNQVVRDLSYKPVNTTHLIS